MSEQPVWTWPEVYVAVMRERNQAEAERDTALLQRDEAVKALTYVHETIEWHHERGILPTIDPHSAVTEVIRKALGLPEGPYRWGEMHRGHLADAAPGEGLLGTTVPGTARPPEEGA